MTQTIDSLSLTASHMPPPSSASVNREDDVRVRVENLGKIFCRDLKRSLWYGTRDAIKDLIPGRTEGRRTAPNGDIVLRKGEFWANQNISFELRKGECLGLIGHNGAGKTTLLKMLNGLIKPDVGRIEMRGRVGALIALGAGFNPILTGRENIYVNGSILGLTKREIDSKLEEIIDFSEIREFIDSPVQNYSSGMAVRLGFAVASALSPDVLLLDEVLAVGDVAFQAKCFNMLASLRREGTPFILVSHNMHQVARYCDKVLYLSHGEIKYLGEAAEGIRMYTEEMGETDLGKDQEGTVWGRPFGSGAIELLSVKFQDRTGQEISTLPVGEELTLRIDLRANAARGIKPKLDLIIRENEDSLFQINRPIDNIEGYRSTGTTTLLVRFPNIPFNCNRISFFLCLVDSQTKAILDWKRNIGLKIEINGKHQSKNVLKTDWQFQNLPASSKI